MFSDNQIFQITGETQQIEDALKTVLNFSGNDTLLTSSRNDKNPYVLGFTVKDNKYLLGILKSTDDDIAAKRTCWAAYPFDYDTNITALIIAQWLVKQETAANDSDTEYADDWERGFLLSVEKYEDPRVICGFQPYEVIYSK